MCWIIWQKSATFTARKVILHLESSLFVQTGRVMGVTFVFLPLASIVICRCRWADVYKRPFPWLWRNTIVWSLCPYFCVCTAAVCDCASGDKGAFDDRRKWWHDATELKTSAVSKGEMSGLLSCSCDCSTSWWKLEKKKPRFPSVTGIVCLLEKYDQFNRLQCDFVLAVENHWLMLLVWKSLLSPHVSTVIVLKQSKLCDLFLFLWSLFAFSLPSESQIRVETIGWDESLQPFNWVPIPTSLELY